MKIVQINSIDIKGGAAIVAYGLHKMLLAAGHDSKMLVGEKYSDDAEVIKLATDEGLISRFKRAYRKWSGGSGELLYSDKASASELLELDIIKDADIIHLHNTHKGYLNIPVVGELAKKKPLVWTLHDMWAVTGHCAHSFDCERWKVGCGQCPRLDTYVAINDDCTEELWKVKSDSYRNARINITVPSKWLLDILKESMLKDQPITLVPNAVDTDIFKPLGKEGLREKLGLPSDRFILTFTADYASQNIYKGFNYLIDALAIIRDAAEHDPYAVIIGESNPALLEKIGLDGKCVEHIDDPKMMVEYNNASDAFVLPSNAENSPLVVIENLVCGTPVVAFDVGGVSELVEHKVNGYVAKYKDAEDLARGIEWIMDRSDDEYKAIRQSAIATVEAKHRLDQQYNNFIELYESILADGRLTARSA